MNMTTPIYVIGDSHTSFWVGKSIFTEFTPIGFGVRTAQDTTGRFIAYHLGPVLAYSMNKMDSTTQGRIKVDNLIANGLLPEGSTVMCVFGEIDLRVHILKTGGGGTLLKE